MTKAESKYFNTARRMDEAFLELLEKKDIEYITVREICEKAEVNRSTFYQHYETIGDLLSEYVEYVNAQFLSYYEEKPSVTGEFIDRSTPDQLFLITPEYLKPYFSFIQEHKSVFRTALVKYQSLRMESIYNRMFSNVLNPILEKYGIPAEERDYILAFYIDGTMGIIKRWLQSDCEESVDKITEIMMKVIRR
ncbi:MAG: TetR/AcrR family transcriptional regulator [Lachnospiraceae bacterium]|nr:TetR/AcrR family transcriptional regulator [Lachnospiraceae bacterium]